MCIARAYLHTYYYIFLFLCLISYVYICGWESGCIHPVSNPVRNPVSNPV